MSEPETPEPMKGYGPAPTHGPKKLISEWVELRQARVENLQLDGLSVRRIAEIVGVDTATAQRDIQMIRARRREEVGATGLREHRDLTLARLEQQRSRILVDMADDPGDPTATPPRPERKAVVTRWQGHRLLLQVEKQRAELLGLNAPAKVQLQEFAPEDEGHETLDEAPKERTLGDILTANPEAATALAEVIHLSERAG